MPFALDEGHDPMQNGAPFIKQSVIEKEICVRVIVICEKWLFLIKKRRFANCNLYPKQIGQFLLKKKESASDYILSPT